MRQRSYSFVTLGRFLIASIGKRNPNFGIKKLSILKKLEHLEKLKSRPVSGGAWLFNNK